MDLLLRSTSCLGYLMNSEFLGWISGFFLDFQTCNTDSRQNEGRKERRNIKISDWQNDLIKEVSFMLMELKSPHLSRVGQ